ncbi:MAG TPA: sulfite oxidase [Candidatus Thermoplasmatota archaeon]|nr:sulfite oxidase [Candidatus Thermoplasmatota archaeon]
MRDEDVITREPLNVESSWDALAPPITPIAGFYTRNNFPIPSIAKEAWRLQVHGFDRAFSLSYGDLTARPSQTIDVVLECAGNGRSYFDPKPSGTAWRERAVACARFTGAPLHELLDDAGVSPGTAELLFRGADHDRTMGFERSLPVKDAREAGALLVWEMNGAALEPRHGAPVRLVVPSWYGVASVKWLVEVRGLRRPFTGHFQRERYVYQAAEGAPTTPVREKRVNSLIVAPTPDASVRAGAPTQIRGWAWSGQAPIARVEVSTDGGRRWSDAKLDLQKERHAWRGWSAEWSPRAGETVILARATDAAGNAQPEKPAWNVHGYGYNAPRPRRVVVR